MEVGGSSVSLVLTPKAEGIEPSANRPYFAFCNFVLAISVWRRFSSVDRATPPRSPLPPEGGSRRESPLSGRSGALQRHHLPGRERGRPIRWPPLWILPESARSR